MPFPFQDHTVLRLLAEQPEWSLANIRPSEAKAVVDEVDRLRALLEANDPSTLPDYRPEIAIAPGDVADARINMVHQLHEAVFGETWARPESPHDVWRMLLDRVRSVRRSFDSGNVRADGR